jgi:hypothetical protein
MSGLFDPPDLPDQPIVALRSALRSSAAHIVGLEGAVTAAQERLRRELTKVEKLRELITLYEADEAPDVTRQLDLPKSGWAVVGLSGTSDGTGGPRLPADAYKDGRISKKAQMTRSIEGLLGLRGSVHRAEILAHLQKAGIMGHESDPMAHLAAFLSGERDKFASDGRGNFTLRPPPVANDLPPAPSDAGSAGVEDTGPTSAHP